MTISIPKYFLGCPKLVSQRLPINVVFSFPFILPGEWATWGPFNLVIHPLTANTSPTNVWAPVPGVGVGKALF